MSSPIALTGSRTLLSSPTLSWETVAGNINEQPFMIQNGGKYFLVYSASQSSDDAYCNGMLTNTDGNVTTATSWTKSTGCVFASSGNVYGPTIRSIVQSPDGTETWSLYQAKHFQGSGWDRNIRSQKISWNADSSPNFGTPLAGGSSLTIPSGEPTFCTTCNTYYGWGGSTSSTNANGDWNPLSNLEVRNMTLGITRMQIFQGVQTSNYTASVSVKADQYGSSLANPRYGMYAAYLDANNYVTVLFDPVAGQLSTEAVVGGVAQAKQNTAITLTYTIFHTLSVIKSGTTFTFSMDGTLEQTRTLSLATGQSGLITEDVIAEFRGFSLK
jgi:hypothetical protein